MARLLLLAVVAASIVGGILATPPADATPVMAPTSLPPIAAPSGMSPDQIAAGHGCMLTGDLVFSPEGTTSSNPADIAQALCGH